MDKYTKLLKEIYKHNLQDKIRNKLHYDKFCSTKEAKKRNVERVLKSRKKRITNNSRS